MDNRDTRWHDARVTVWTHGVRKARVHPIVEERLLRLALRLALVAPPQDVHWSRRVELVGKVAAHFGLVRALVAHDQHLTTKAVESMGVEQHIDRSVLNKKVSQEMRGRS